MRTARNPFAAAALGLALLAISQPAAADPSASRIWVVQPDNPADSWIAFPEYCQPASPWTGASGPERTFDFTVAFLPGPNLPAEYAAFLKFRDPVHPGELNLGDVFELTDYTERGFAIPNAGGLVRVPIQVKPESAGETPVGICMDVRVYRILGGGTYEPVRHSMWSRCRPAPPCQPGAAAPEGTNIPLMPDLNTSLLIGP
jgi:hypothetical protein